MKKNERGEQVFCEIVRNRSGADSGELDFTMDMYTIQDLKEPDRQKALDAMYNAYSMASGILGKKAKRDK